MNAPRIEIIPSRPAICSDSPITLDLVIRITPPAPEVHFPRPPLNLALVLDRSGSMAGAKKMLFARMAASFVVEQLLPTDRVSVTTFDSAIETVLPSTTATDKLAIKRRIEAIVPRGCTNLEGGWAAGALQVAEHMVEGGLNRVLLLSDGQTNEGVTDPNTITAGVRARADRGVGTTTLGVGDDYNEDLMEAMARSGNGNYYYIEDPAQLVDLFQTELQGLMGTRGQRVSLGLEVGPGASLSEILNDFEKAPTGRLMLPNLVVGMPIPVVVRLTVPPQAGPLAPLAVRLAWDDPEGLGRRTATATLAPLPAIPLAAWSTLPVAPPVSEQVTLLTIARAQKEASRAHEAGDHDLALMHLRASQGYGAGHAPTAALSEELGATSALIHAFEAGDDMHAQKLAKYRAYRRQTGRATPPPTLADDPGAAGQGTPPA